MNKLYNCKIYCFSNREDLFLLFALWKSNLVVLESLKAIDINLEKYKK